jgi:hypothetical protein
MLKAADRPFDSHRTAGWRKIFTAKLNFLSGFPVPLTFVRFPAEDLFWFEVYCVQKQQSSASQKK